MNSPSLKINKEKIQLILRHPHTAKLFSGLLLILTMLLLYQTYRKAYRPFGYDLSSYLLSAEAFLAGANPYQTDTVFPFIYPLFLSVVMIPLSLLPYWLSVFIWFAANLAALFFSAKLFLQHYFGSALSTQRLSLFFSLSFILLFGIISNNFLNGQINMLVLLLCILFLHYYLKGQKGRACWLLAAAIVTKLTPAIFLVYLLLKKDFKSIILLGLQCLALALLLPMLIAGSQVFEFYAYYFQHFILSKLSSEAAHDGTVSFALMPLLSSYLPLPSIVAFLLSALLALSLPVYLQLSDIGTQHGRLKGLKELAVFSLYLLAMLLISPMSETHHLIHIYPAVLLMMCSLTAKNKHLIRISAASLLAVALLVAAGKAIPAGFLGLLLLGYAFIWYSWHRLQQSARQAINPYDKHD